MEYDNAGLVRAGSFFDRSEKQAPNRHCFPPDFFMMDLEGEKMDRGAGAHQSMLIIRGGFCLTSSRLGMVNRNNPLSYRAVIPLSSTTSFGSISVRWNAW